VAVPLFYNELDETLTVILKLVDHRCGSHWIMNKVSDMTIALWIFLEAWFDPVEKPEIGMSARSPIDGFLHIDSDHLLSSWNTLTL